MACAALAAAPVARGASPDPKDLAVPEQDLSKARALIRQLGSDVYREREEAQAELAKMGRLARRPLAEAVAADADPEIRQRCGRLLSKATSEDLKARVETFLADAAGKYEHDLPGLKTFRTHVGTTDKARALYAEILKSPYNIDMFVALDRGPAEGGKAISDRRTAMWNDLQNNNNRFGGQINGGKPFTPRYPTLAETAALLFAETVVPSDQIPKSGVWTWVNGAQFIQQNASMQALNGTSTPHAEAYRGIVARWLITRTDPQELMNLSYQLGQGGLQTFKESRILLRRIVLTEGVQGYAKGQAMNALLMGPKLKEERGFLVDLLHGKVKISDYPGVLPAAPGVAATDAAKSLVRTLLPGPAAALDQYGLTPAALAPRTINVATDVMIQQVWFNRPNNQNEIHTCQMRDVVLAYLITLDGGKVQDYGFEVQQGAVINQNQLGYGQYAFTSEAARHAGFMKYAWKQFKDGIDGPAPKEAPKNETKPQPTPQYELPRPK